MKKQIAALSINKVQTFLFDVIHAHVQEKQVEQATLKNIMNASKEISDDFQRVIKSKFAGVEMQELLFCSGMYIFSCVLPESEIKKRLNELFLDYYKNSQGKKQLRYICFEAGQKSEIEVIKRAKEELKKSARLTEIIEKNKKILFSFQPASENQDKFMNDTDQYPMFAADINALFNQNEAENKNHFRIAVIKADLDSMGKLFEKIDNYQEYRDISRLLNTGISLDGLHQVAKKIALDNQKGWLYPFYIAGDDIFFAVSAANMIKGINVCRQILQDINRAIKKMHPKRELSMSIGVEITFNREPVRYYLSMVEKQLKCAKRAAEYNGWANKVLSKFLQTKIAIGGTTYFDIDYAEVKQYKKRLKGTRDKMKMKINRELGTVPVWSFFLNEVKVLNSVRKDDSIKDLIGTPGFYYALLNTLTEVHDNDVKYCNNLLYHLRPKYLNSPTKELRKKELLLNRGIIRQLYQKTLYGDKIIINEVTKRRLEAYLRLMILFSDDRFRVRIGDDEKDRNFREEDIKKELLRKPMEYLYDNLKCGHGSKLICYFADYLNYEAHDEKKGKYLQRLRIEKSMFFRLREMGKVTVEKAANMIEMQNPSSDKKSSEINVSPYRMEFLKEEFCRAAKGSGQWTTDFVDSLMLLYEYNDLIIKFYPIKRKGV